MNLFILIEGEFRSLIRNSLEKLIGNNFDKQKNPYLDIILKLSIRVVSSLIAIYIFNKLKNNDKVLFNNIIMYTSYFFIAIFTYILFNKYYSKEESL